MKLEAREYMALAIVMMFGYVIIKDPFNSGYAETLKNVMVMAVGYYLGASKIGSDTAKTNADAIALAATGTNDHAQPVEVVNDADKPIPVEPTDGR
jgi:hypothetical protein